MTLDEYCRTVYSNTISALGFPEGNETDICAFVTQLSEEFRDKYREAEMPNGPTEEGLVEYLLGNVHFIVRDD